MPYGYNGKTLRVNLTEETIRPEEPPESWYRAYLGGMGAIAYHLLKEVPRGAAPLSPGNILVMAPGVISGAPFSGSGRNAIDLYYEMMGWDPAGVPRTGTLHELGIPWAKECLPGRGADRIIV